ncbi:monocarboxylate transporter 12 [Aplysia californica]|uniref:Monocarboxylate transporter 12 n=1 Tax=Aplysia californica TaxID=6500 RepID=A0ABM0JQT5_APLCA|nr:monocarboxylate transporter 12 [Aplysia californica]XP_012938537.1 monocarboxylate transporter 12 [Aplysia californica]XP_035825911.1 monocarboxylate transporter 12 [Aplysia californica]
MFVVTTVSSSAPMAKEDGCWRWVVVVAAFFTQFIVCGITYSLGVFHVIFKDIFYESHFDTSWVGSVLLYVTALSSVMLRFVTCQWGCRVSVMLGGLLAATGLGLCMLVQEMYQLYITFGLITGLGFGLACSPSIVAVERYFVHARFQALSVVVAGIGAGIITFPILIRHLLVHFAWRGAMLILAGIALNLCVCGMLMKPAKHEKEMRLLPMLSCFPLRHPLFHGMCFANLFWSFGSTVIYMYLPSYAMAEGSSFETAVFLVSCVGISSFASRMIFAFMGPNSTLDDVTSALCPIMLGVVITGISPLLFDDYAGQIGYTLLFGFYSGFWTTFLSQASRELLGPEYIAMGNGYLSFMIALGALTGGPLTGLLLKEKGDFKYAFYLAGACLLWSSVVMVLFKLKRCSARLEADSEKADDIDSLKGTKVKEHRMPLILEDVVTMREGKVPIAGAGDIVVDNVITCV